jgi:hypothetical protein
MSFSATAVVLMVMAWVSVFSAANLRTVADLGREIRAVEARQLKHWNAASPRSHEKTPAKPSAPRP